MPNITVSVPHQLPQDEALRRTQARIAQFESQFSSKLTDLRENWTGYVGAFSGSARGHSVSGTVVVSPSLVTVEIAIPLLWLVFKGRIETGIRDELTTLLA